MPRRVRLILGEVGFLHAPSADAATTMIERMRIFRAGGGLPRRAQLTLGAIGMVLVFGLLGLAWWWWRHRSGGQPAGHFRRLGAALVAVGVLVIAVGSFWRLDAAIQPTANCSPPAGEPTATHRAFDAPLLGEEVATWPETGIGLMYARASDGRVCWSRSAQYYVAVNSHNIVGARAMTVGDIVLSPGFYVSRARMNGLIVHEAGHRVQWAVATVIGGPLAFPIAYGVDDFFFPGSRNQFERGAGLDEGGYPHEGTGPVLGPAQLAVLAALAAGIVLAVIGAWHRRASRSRGGADAPEGHG